MIAQAPLNETALRSGGGLVEVVQRTLEAPQTSAPSLMCPDINDAGVNRFGASLTGAPASSATFTRK
jgi:hypothetical protein